MKAQTSTGNFKDLIVWQRAMEVAELVYGLTSKLPPDERFGLVSQMRRAAVSIPSNIAEGHARHTTGEFVQFISHAEGSVAELETQLLLAVNLGLTPTEQAQPVFSLLDEVRRMLNALRRSLVTRP
jgi:four helix bundle protein